MLASVVGDVDGDHWRRWWELITDTVIYTLALIETKKISDRGGKRPTQQDEMNRDLSSSVIMTQHPLYYQHSNSDCHLTWSSCNLETPGEWGGDLLAMPIVARVVKGQGTISFLTSVTESILRIVWNCLDKDLKGNIFISLSSPWLWSCQW